MAIEEATMRRPMSITIRRATPEDQSAVARLTQLEGVRLPAGDLLLAEVDGELWAAAELDTGTFVADPFRPSAEAAELLRIRARRRWDGNGCRRGIRRWLARSPAIPCDA
jgi:hypothetical protein